MTPSRLFGFSVIIASLLLLGAPIPLASALPTPGVLSIAPNLHGSSGCVSPNSCDWAGYGVSAANYAVTRVGGSWIMPSLTGTCPLTSTYDFFAVGVDGLVNNDETEQIGTAIGCAGITASPTYFAWYEAYPSSPGLQIIPSTSIAVHPGDTFATQITYTGTNQFVFSIKDTTTGQSFAKTLVVTFQGYPVPRDSAEWIAETASQCTDYPYCIPQPANILPIVDFSTVSFSSCYATVSGSTESISALGGSALTMNSLSGPVMASPTSLEGPAGGAFKVSWRNAGP